MVNGQKTDHNHDILKFAHDQWSKIANFGHLTTVILKFWSLSFVMVEMTNDHGYFEILAMAWSWSNFFDDTLT